MARSVNADLDFGDVARILNLPDAVDPQEPATFKQLLERVEGLSWKEAARVASQANVTISSPGSSIDGVSLSAGDRVLLRAQTAAAENGIYVWNGAATAMTRAGDADTADKLRAATITVEEGTSADVTYVQTADSITLGTSSLAFATQGTSTPSATETTAGKAELATQAEVDAGTDDQRIVTPLKLANWSGRIRRATADIGDGAATLFSIAHNFGTRDVQVEVFRASGNYDSILVEVRRPSVNQVDIVFASAPSLNAFRAVVTG